MNDYKGERKMIASIDISWNNEYRYDGLLYFLQRIVEMLDFTTIDIYRAPLMNTTRLIDEYLEICHGSAKPYHREECYNEFVSTFRNDLILQTKIGIARIKQIIDRMNKQQDKRKETMEFLQHSINPLYLKWAKECLLEIVPKSKEKKKIERTIRCFLPELLRQGYSRDDIYHSAKELLFHCTNPDEALSIFINQFDLQKKAFNVYFSMSIQLYVFRSILEKRLGLIFEDDGNFHKLEPNKGFFVVKKSNVKALDASKAADDAYDLIELFTSFYQYFGNYSRSLIQKRVLVIPETDDSERIMYVKRVQYKSFEQDDPPKIGELAETMVTNLIQYAKFSLPQLQKIVQLHNRAIANNGLENGFLNLWSIMEIICVTDQEKSKIEQVKSIAIPIIKRDYFPAIFQDICANLQKILDDEQYNNMLTLVTKGEVDYMKIAYLILLPEYSDKFDKFVDVLVNYPVLRTRMLELHDNKTRCDLNSIVNRYAQRISWHLFRIYRARNSIVHQGKKPRDLKDLGEHLHSYVDSLANEVITKLGISTLCNISNVIVDLELQQEAETVYFAQKEIIDESCIMRLISGSSQDFV